MVRWVCALVMPRFGTLKIREQALVAPALVSYHLAPNVEVSSVTSCPGPVVNGGTAGEQAASPVGYLAPSGLTLGSG